MWRLHFMVAVLGKAKRKYGVLTFFNPIQNYRFE